MINYIIIENLATKMTREEERAVLKKCGKEYKSFFTERYQTPDGVASRMICIHKDAQKFVHANPALGWVIALSHKEAARVFAERLALIAE